MGLTQFSSTYTIERQITKSGENLRETDHLEDQGVDGRIILKRWRVEGVDWIYLPQDRD